ncbi:hypothetical protein [Nocardioides sp. KR10-350]|uniref:hypothetical protein n=1 Tax=Nocardioides cheoyonin TaxID=3156615 RepID=UPI0032B3C3F0
MGDPQWMERLLRQGSPYARLAQWLEDVSAPRGKRLALIAQHHSNSGPIPFSFKDVPAKTEIAVVVQASEKWVLSDLKPTAALDLLRMDQARGTNDSGVHLSDTVRGTVKQTVEQGRSGAITTDEACEATLVLLKGDHQPWSVGPKTRVELHGGTLGAGDYGTIHLIGDAGLPNQPSGVVRIKHLTVHDERTFTMTAHGGHRLSTTRLEGATPRSSLALVRGAAPGNTSPQDSEVQVESVDQLRIEAETRIRFALSRVANDVEFVAASRVQFGRGFVGAGLRFTPSEEQWPIVTARAGAILTDVSGEIVIESVQGAHIEAGEPKGYQIADIRGPTGPGNRPANDDLCRDAFISGFTVPPGLTGRRLLNYLATAHHLEPATTALPGWEFRALGKHGLREAANAASSDERRRREHDAELMRELRRLAHEKGASGSARTKVGWCAQRLRHVTTRGRVESVALWAYRLLGYGERPGPALLTWVALSVVVAIAAVLFTPAVWGHLPQEIVIQAVSPLAGVLRAGTAPEREDWMYVTRALIAVPLVTGLLSLRHYVRATD